ncbi:response regulator [Ferrovibrio sp.]|uniref:response regulator n=1 Tax=Ferrovibrio sp. TaxID=1917215 RepID=UPI003D0A2B04
MNRQSFAAYRVLVVDDQHEMIDLLSRMLRRMGFTDLHTAHSAREAEELLNKQSFHLLLTDYAMTGNSGAALVAKLRSGDLPWATPSDTPAIMITGHGERDFVIQARNVGVNAYLVKPVTPQQLEAKIAVVLRG